MGAIRNAAGEWLRKFERALAQKDAQLFGSLFHPEANWRDMVAFTWNTNQFHGRDAMAQYALEGVDDIRPSGFVVDDAFPLDPISRVEHLPTETYEVNFVFETAGGSCDGLVHLSPSETPSHDGIGYEPDPSGGWRGSLLFTRLDTLRDNPPVWPRFGRYSQDELESEAAAREQHRRYVGHDPEVLVVGGGHNGVFVAAQLGRLGVDTLVVDRYPRPGDAWRLRYDPLVLHMPQGMMQFPYMPFPESFPDYLTKDRFADWYISYIDALDINLWTSTEFVGGSYDEETERWTVQLRLADGSIREMHPKDLVLAMGHTGTPRMPDLAGLDDFAGPVRHSSQFKSGTEYAGKRVMIVGAGVSAHDIAFGIVRKGGQATMFQRTPICVVDLDTANMNYTSYNERKLPTDVLDKRWLASLVKPAMLETFKMLTALGNERDKELHEGLVAAGLAIDWDPYGWFAKYFVEGGGYYINVGASQAIINGDIKVRQRAEVDRVVEKGVRLKSGEVEEFDAIICATGFHGEHAALERLFGAEVAARVGHVGGFDEEGEPERNGYRPLPGQPHLYINGGGVGPGRWYSKPVALLIATDRAGVIPPEFKKSGHPSRSPSGDLVRS